MSWYNGFETKTEVQLLVDHTKIIECIQNSDRIWFCMTQSQIAFNPQNHKNTELY